MFIQLLFVFLLVPLADLVALLVLTRFTSIWFTVGLVVLSGLIGVWLARRQWRWLGREAQTRLARNEIPAELASDALIVLLAAGLLITPGCLTDLLGLSLLIPQCRGWYKQRLLNLLKSQFNIRVYGQARNSAPADEDTIDGHFRAGRSRDTEFDSEPLPKIPR